jgi:shikimate kinase
MKSLIFLIGMPGTGKTTIGKRLAKSLQCSFVDLDERIVNNYRTSINTIFIEKGERFFRSIENITLLKLINDTNSSAIIACGGGTPAFLNNLSMMKHNGIVIHLSASAETLFKRLYQSGRPMFNNNSNKDETRQQVIQLLHQRAYYYQQADFTYPTDRISNQTVSALERLITNRLESINS